MKIKATILSFLFLVFSTIAAFAADKTTEVFTLDHQMSSHCEKKIVSNLRHEKGIKDLKVSLKENTITITYDTEKTDTQKIIGAFKKIGFNAQRVTESTPATSCGGSCCGKHEK